jgi:hypothetical protein
MTTVEDARIVVNGTPTKEFFVEMLTRDIDLTDAILDLLDNCLDGVVRLKGPSVSSDHEAKMSVDYSGFHSYITITEDGFTIEDNCGGISKDIAINSAFRMGREKGSMTDENLPTVGIYGIGMKRAIFKIGRAATVISKWADEQFQVLIPDEWSSSEGWELELEDLPSVPDGIKQGGVIISIYHINQAISAQWKDEDKRKNFVDKLIDAIKQNYSLIIEKGFSIKVNSNIVSYLPTKLMVSASQKGHYAISPYIYKDVIDGVNVELIVGFYKSVISTDEIDEINESHRSTPEAGWTIVCNDRVVLYNDKTHQTGWGEGGVPKYHTQFTGIKGIVFFRSNNPKLLPTTTTKRGIDLSSEIYSQVKERMKEGMVIFTSYTNQWKGRLDEEKKYSNATDNIPMRDLLNNDSVIERYNLNENSKTKKGSSAVYIVPKLPKPEIENDTLAIRFFKPADQIEFLAENLFDQDLEGVKPSTIGERRFDIVYKQCKGER